MSEPKVDEKYEKLVEENSNEFCGLIIPPYEKVDETELTYAELNLDGYKLERDEVKQIVENIQKKLGRGEKIPLDIEHHESMVCGHVTEAKETQSGGVAIKVKIELPKDVKPEEIIKKLIMKQILGKFSLSHWKDINEPDSVALVNDGGRCRTQILEASAFNELVKASLEEAKKKEIKDASYFSNKDVETKPIDKVMEKSEAENSSVTKEEQKEEPSQNATPVATQEKSTAVVTEEKSSNGKEDNPEEGDAEDRTEDVADDDEEDPSFSDPVSKEVFAKLGDMSKAVYKISKTKGQLGQEDRQKLEEASEQSALAAAKLIGKVYNLEKKLADYEEKERKEKSSLAREIASVVASKKTRGVYGKEEHEKIAESLYNKYMDMDIDTLKDIQETNSLFSSPGNSLVSASSSKTDGAINTKKATTPSSLKSMVKKEMDGGFSRKRNAEEPAPRFNRESEQNNKKKKAQFNERDIEREVIENYKREQLKQTQAPAKVDASAKSVPTEVALPSHLSSLLKALKPHENSAIKPLRILASASSISHLKKSNITSTQAQILEKDVDEIKKAIAVQEKLIDSETSTTSPEQADNIWIKSCNFQTVAKHHEQISDVSEVAKMTMADAVLDLIGEKDQYSDVLSSCQVNASAKTSGGKSAYLFNEMEAINPNKLHQLADLIRASKRMIKKKDQTPYDFLISNGDIFEKVLMPMVKPIVCSNESSDFNRTVITPMFETGDGGYRSKVELPSFEFDASRWKPFY